jgi:rod shape-determining protein MreB
LADPLREILDAVKAALDRCSPELAADLVDNGLVLCGGGALLRHIDRFFHEQTGLPARIATDPLTAVAKGLLICMEHFQQWRRWLQSSEEDV